MAKRRISTTVDPELWEQARATQRDSTDSSVVEKALLALIAEHRNREVDARYARALDAHPWDEPDEWGDLVSWADAVGRS